MKNKLEVFKFGGASIKDAASMRHVAGILQSFKGQPLIIVVSALGKMTNALEKVVEAHAAQNGKANQLLADIKERHFSIARELLGEDQNLLSELHDTFVEIDWALEEAPHDNFDYMYDQVVSIGELASSKIFSAFIKNESLHNSWLDARDVIRTNNLYREAWVDWPETEKRIKVTATDLLEKASFVVTQGFIGSSSENFTTTLGREGSDYTAAIFSFCLDAQKMTIWKDVPGVLTADPRIFDHVTKLDRLSYKEAIEMTYYGAKVIHPKTIKPLQNKSIPLAVKSFLKPEGTGTHISNEVEDTYPPLVAVEQNQALLHISTRDFSFVAEHHLRYLFSVIADHRLQVNMMQNTAISFSICVNDIDDRVSSFARQIEDQFKVLIDRELELITVRHYQQPMLDNLRKGKVVMMEERIRNTLQMVVKDVPVLNWKTEDV